MNNINIYHHIIDLDTVSDIEVKISNKLLYIDTIIFYFINGDNKFIIIEDSIFPYVLSIQRQFKLNQLLYDKS
jgi:hypothetical protein